MKFVFLVLSSFMFNGVTRAQNDEALSKAQEVLTNPSKRAEAIRGDAKAMDTDRKVKELAGDEQTTEQIYGLSSDVLKAMLNSVGGDSQKLQQLIVEVGQNPEKLKQFLSPEALKKLENTAKSIEAKDKKLP